MSLEERVRQLEKKMDSVYGVFPPTEPKKQTLAERLTRADGYEIGDYVGEYEIVADEAKKAFIEVVDGLNTYKLLAPGAEDVKTVVVEDLLGRIKEL